MASRIKKVYIDLQDILESLTDSNSKILFQYINIWDNQVENSLDGDTYSFATPAIFVEFNLNEAKPLMGGFTSFPNTVITFHIVNNVLGVDAKMEQNLDIFDLRDAVFAKMNKKALTFVNAMQPYGESQDFKHNNVYRYTLSFTANFMDNKGGYDDTDGKTFGKLINPTLNLNVFNLWCSGKEYTGLADGGLYIVTYRGAVYYCNITNSDIIFNPDNWVEIKPWIPPIKYLVDDIVCWNNNIYICITENEDIVFDESKWNLIF